MAVALAVRSSLSALHALGATPAAIKQAEKTLFDVTKALNPYTCIEVAHVLLAPLLSPTASNSQTQLLSVAELHFGFHLLDEIILRTSHPWASFPDDVRAAVRQIAVKLFQNLSEVDGNGARVYRSPQVLMEKTIALLSAVAVREWPQRWETFLDDLLAEPRRAETCCHVLRVMSEEIHDYQDSIEPVRRQELMHAMALTLSKSLGFVNAAANAFHQRKNYQGLNAALDTIHAFLSWASLHEVFSVGVPEACFALLRDPETRDRSLSALTALVRRNFTQAGNRPDKKHDGDVGSPEVESEVKFRDIIFGGLLKFVSISSIPSMTAFSFLPSTGRLPALMDMYSRTLNTHQELEGIEEEEYEFHVAFFTMLSELGCTNFYNTYLFSKRKGAISLSQDEQQCAAAYVELMLCATASPSFCIREAVLPFFAAGMGTITKHLSTTVPLQDLARFLVTGYLQAAFLALIRFPADVDRIAARFEEIDFVDDPRRQKDLHENFIARTISSMGVASKLCPDFACTPGLKRFVKLLSAKPVLDATHASEDALKHVGSARAMGFVIPDGTQHGWDFGNFGKASWSAWECCLYATIIASEAMINGATSSPLSFSRGEMNELMRCGFELTMEITEKPLLPLKAHALRIFSPLYACEPKLLERCFHTLISQGSNLTGTGASRFRACLAISILCRRLGSTGLKYLGNYRKPMCQYTSEAVASRIFETVNKTLLLEASISTILVSGDIPEQTALVEQLMDPILKDLESDKAKLVMQSPNALFDFTSSGNPNDVAYICEAFQLLETATHQIVKPSSKISGSISIPNVLSNSIAPRGVHIAADLVKALHGMYNISKFPLDDPQRIRQSALLPTSRELTALLNLEVGAHWRREHSHDLSKGGEDEQLGSLGEQRSGQILRQYGIDPPDPRQNQNRETLKNLRRSAYEILRSTILSGVTSSVTHLPALLTAVTVDCYFLEPIHLVELTNKVLRPLLSFPVVSPDPSFLDIVETSEVPNLLKIIREHIESAKLGEIVDSEAPLVDVARDYGRKTLARTAADFIANMYPRAQAIREGDTSQILHYMPHVFKCSILGNEIRSLWGAICSPGRGFLDSGAARVGFGQIVAAVEIAPVDNFELFSPLLESSLRTAVLNFGLNDDSPFNSAIGAVLSVMRKWPRESKSVLHSVLAGPYREVLGWVNDCIDTIAETGQKNSKPKKHRGLVVDLVSKVAKLSGVELKPRSTVKALPEKLVTNNPARSRNKPRNELEEIVLGDQALDSLFGGGDPL